MTVPSKLGAAQARGTNVSTVVTEAIAHRVRLAALDDALAAATRRFGPVPEEMIAEAEADLRAAPEPARSGPARLPPPPAWVEAWRRPTGGSG